MTKLDKTKIKNIVIISVILFIIEILVFSVVGIFYRILLAFYALSRIKEDDLFSVKVVLVMMLLPALYALVNSIWIFYKFL